MTNRYYEKVWHEIIDDIKLGPLPGELKWRFVQLIVLAGITSKDGELPDLPDMAFRLRLTEEQLRSDLPTLARRELVELRRNENGNERWFVTNYSKRQSAMDAGERQRRSRSGRKSSSASSASAAYSSFEEDIVEEEVIVNIVTHPVTIPVTLRDKNVTAELLAEAGIARNRTTAPLWNLPADYVAAHIAAAPNVGLAIRRMLDNDQPPRARRKILPEDYEDIIQR